MSIRRAFDYPLYLLVRIIIAVVQAVRIETCVSACRALAWLMFDVVKLRRQLVDENLAQAFPEKSLAERNEIGRGMWVHLLTMVCEIAHAPRKIHSTNWRKYIKLQRGREFVGSLLLARPRVLVTAHFGNFEVAGLMSGMLGISTFTVTRTLDNPYLDEFVLRFRELNWQFILPKNGSANQADTVLKNKGALALLGDQHAGPKGCWVDFFGRPASCHKALALFTLLSDAPMILLYCKRRDKPLHFELGLADIADPQALPKDCTDVKRLTQWYNRVLEDEIRKAPDQYWWLHRRWRDPPQRARAKASLRDAATPTERRDAA
ncbi:Lipid A biosynthesis lauroyl acyltransferase [Anatilimnocola aggregata]|uniref:Lipid A biosynthesis lauroyl acyltransferase n=1 Tax=Anatilimnocola aggregata TaxID=2528021 RepID=A0A517Y9L0_9BACT|nr:lysophospholipid acyltransferase family protein [Anatilimnocola aggregata]QDU26852.1 Lipid A biosynthesis lauroyl acyltransferase [Anatilimnocola aggregata]